jgi:hypothetical protein
MTPEGVQAQQQQAAKDIERIAELERKRRHPTVARLEMENKQLREKLQVISNAVNGTTYRVIDGELFEIIDGVPAEHPARDIGTKGETT